MILINMKKFKNKVFKFARCNAATRATYMIHQQRIGSYPWRWSFYMTQQFWSSTLGINSFSLVARLTVREVQLFTVTQIREDLTSSHLISPVNEGSKMANRNKNRVVLKFGRIVERSVLNNILKVPADRRWAGTGEGAFDEGFFPVFHKYLKNYAS